MDKRELWRKRIRYFSENWKLIFHLLFSTYRFGVNNRWWSDFDSMFGVPWYKRTPWKMLENFRGMRFRATACKFVSKETVAFLWPNYKPDKEDPENENNR